MKKLLIIALVGIVVCGVVFAPFGAEVAFAAPGDESVQSGEPNGWQCTLGGFLNCLTWAFAKIGTMIMDLFGVLLDISGAVLNYSIDLSIVKANALLTTVPMVDVGWKVFRDIANLLFIFVLLWVGIRLILGIDASGGKKLVGWVVLMALLINFSLFITKAVVDVGNILTLHFYNAVRPNLVVDGVEKAEKAGLSDIYMEGLKLQTLMADTEESFSVAAVGGFLDQFWKIIVSTFFGSIFILVTAFVFFAAAFFFITRAVMLMFLMLLSPLAFAAQAIPGLQGKAKQFWDTLLKQTFFAPMYMALAYVIGKTIQSDAFGQLLQIEGNEASFAALLTAPASDNVGIVINYLILIFMMGYALMLARWGGAVGAETVIGWGKTLRGIGEGMILGGAGGVAARFLGGAARAATGGLQGSTSTLGRAALRAADRMQNVKIGGGKSYREQQEQGTFTQVGEQEVDRNMRSFRNDPARQAQYLAALPEGQRRRAYGQLSARDRVAVERAGGLSPAQIDDVYGRLNPEERDKVDEARRKVRQEEGNEQNYAAVEAIATPPAGAPPLTTADMDTRVGRLRPNQARDLSHEARINPEVIRRLSPQHLRDLMENGNLLPNEITAIMTEITGATAYPAQAAQLAYVQNPTNAVLWI